MRSLFLWAFPLAAGAAAATGQAAVNLEFRPLNQVVNLGDAVGVGLYAVSDDASTQFTSAIDAIFTWDPAFLQLVGVDGTGGAPLLASTFFPDGHGLNESNPPQDGDGFYTAFAMPGNPVGATSSGTLITTFVFQTLQLTPLTPVDLLATGGSPQGSTTVFHATIPATSITGTLHGATITIIPAPGAAGLLGLAGLAASRRRSRTPRA